MFFCESAKEISRAHSGITTALQAEEEARTIPGPATTWVQTVPPGELDRSNSLKRKGIKVLGPIPVLRLPVYSFSRSSGSL